MFPIFKKRALLITAGGAMATLLAAGCSHQDETPPAQVNTTTNVTPPAAAPGAPGNTVVVPGATNTVTRTSVTPSTNNTNAGSGGATGSQTAVADAVNKAIHNNAQMTGSRVTAVVNASGEARLTGTAQNAQQKGLAESTTRQTSGVSSVINKIEIVPTGGAKSAATTKTKIVVVHDKSSTGTDASANQPAPSNAGDTSSASDSGNAAGTSTTSGTDNATTPTADTDTKSQ